MKTAKLVTQDYKTRAGEPNETLWKPGVTVAATGTGGLCTDGQIHSYRDEYIAAFMNPAHADIENPRCLMMDTSGDVIDDGTKLGSKSATWTGEEIPLPEITLEQRVEIAIRCAMRVYTELKWTAWANAWLSGKDRTHAYANAAAVVASAASAASSSSAAAYAAYAANAAACAAAYYAAYAAADAAYYAAYAAADAAAAAAAADAGKFDLSAIIRQVLGGAE